MKTSGEIKQRIEEIKAKRKEALQKANQSAITMYNRKIEMLEWVLDE